MQIRSLFAAAALAFVATGALAETAIGTATLPEGKVLVDGQGMSLYIFDKDTPGTSNCTGACAEKWPPLMAVSGAEPQGEFGIITRPDAGMYGGKQWTYKGMPLYTWVNDTAPGDVTGDGVKGVWHLARP